MKFIKSLISWTNLLRSTKKDLKSINSLSQKSYLLYPLLLDGGLSNELERLGYTLNTALWASELLVSAPEAIVQAHLSYLKAGAKCILTASYQASFEGLQKVGYSHDESSQLILKSVELAQYAIQQYLEEASNADSISPIIGASIGPYGAYLADGSEYSGNYQVSAEVLFNFHQRKVQLLDDSQADVLVFETVPSYQEALVIKQIIKDVAKPVWISFSCKDHQHINDGTPFSTCIKLFKDHAKVEAIGINCTPPHFIPSLLTTLKDLAPNKRALVYPNSGEIYHADTKTWSGDSSPQSCTAMAKAWLSLGADIVGGCCRMGPAHIQAMGLSLQKSS